MSARIISAVLTTDGSVVTAMVDGGVWVVVSSDTDDASTVVVDPYGRAAIIDMYLPAETDPALVRYRRAADQIADATFTINLTPGAQPR